jgi:hypothetical protein
LQERGDVDAGAIVSEDESCLTTVSADYEALRGARTLPENEEEVFASADEVKGDGGSEILEDGPDSEGLVGFPDGDDGDGNSRDEELGVDEHGDRGVFSQ